MIVTQKFRYLFFKIFLSLNYPSAMVLSVINSISFARARKFLHNIRSQNAAPRSIAYARVAGGTVLCLEIEVSKVSPAFCCHGLSI